MVRSNAQRVAGVFVNAEPLETRRLFAGTVNVLVYFDSNNNTQFNLGEEVFGPGIYVDLNNNGRADGGEPYQSAQGLGTSFNLDDGNYTFRTVPMQNYPVFEPSDGSHEVTVNGDMINIQFGISMNAGYATGVVYHDANENQAIDPGESLLEGMRVYADTNDNGQHDAGELQNITGADGIWTMYVPPTTVKLRIENTSEYSVASPASGYYEVTFVNGQQSGGGEFAMSEVGTSGVSGTLFVDANTNGSYDAQDDTLLENWNVYIDENSNGDFDIGEEHTSTNAQGEWSFSNMNSGTYDVRVIVQNGYEIASPVLGVHSYALGVGQVVNGEIFTVAELPAPTNSVISGFVYDDANGNGAKDVGETGRQHVEIYLDINNNGEYDQGDVLQLTGQAGGYSFTNLAAGAYRVRINPPGNAVVGAPLSGLRSLTADGSTTYDNTNFGLRTGEYDHVRTDFNGDGKSDVFIRNANSGVNTVWLMNGAQRTATATLPPASAAWSLGGTGDFNDDGHDDIVWHNNDSGATTIWLMNGAQRTSSVALPTVPNVWRVAGVADWNGDGFDDIVWRRTDSGAATVWHMYGTSLRQHNPFRALPAVANLQWNLEAIADFNADGQDDLFWTNSITGAQSAWLMDGYNLAQNGFRSIRTPQSTGWRLVSTSDFNNDGRSDLLWINDEQDGKDSLWLIGNTDTTPVAVTFTRLQSAA